jgi:hypothetical protein
LAFPILMYVGPSLYQYGISFFPPRKMLGNISYISIFLVVSHPIFGQTQLLHVGYIYIYTVYIYIYPVIILLYSIPITIMNFSHGGKQMVLRFKVHPATLGLSRSPDL